MTYKMRTIDANKLFQMNEALASLLQEGKLDKADKLDEEMIQYVGTNGRVVINQVVAPPRLMYMYAFNRAITNSWSLLKLMPIELVMPSNHFILCCPLLLLPSIFPSIRIFPLSQLFTSGDQSIGVSASASVFPMNIQG